MALRRRLSGLGPRLTHDAREMYRSGATRREVEDRLAVNHPAAPSSLIRRIAGMEETAQSGVDRLARANLGAFARAATAAGCSDPNARVRVSLGVVVWDPRRETNKLFDTSVDLKPSGRLRDILAGAIGAVEAEAASRGYEVYGVSPNMRSGNLRYQLNYVDCL